MDNGIKHSPSFINTEVRDKEQQSEEKLNETEIKHLHSFINSDVEDDEEQLKIIGQKENLTPKLSQFNISKNLKDHNKEEKTSEEIEEETEKFKKKHLAEIKGSTKDEKNSSKDEKGSTKDEKGSTKDEKDLLNDEDNLLNNEEIVLGENVKIDFEKDKKHFPNTTEILFDGKKIDSTQEDSDKINQTINNFFIELNSKNHEQLKTDGEIETILSKCNLKEILHKSYVENGKIEANTDYNKVEGIHVAVTGNAVLAVKTSDDINLTDYDLEFKIKTGNSYYDCLYNFDTGEFQVKINGTYISETEIEDEKIKKTLSLTKKKYLFHGPGENDLRKEGIVCGTGIEKDVKKETCEQEQKQEQEQEQKQEEGEKQGQKKNQKKTINNLYSSFSEADTEKDGTKAKNILKNNNSNNSLILF